MRDVIPTCHGGEGGAGGSQVPQLEVDATHGRAEAGRELGKLRAQLRQTLDRLVIVLEWAGGGGGGGGCLVKTC